MADDPMRLTSAHLEEWRQSFDTLGSSRARDGTRKTFSLNPAGDYKVVVGEVTVYRGGNEAEALIAYDEA